MRSSTVNIFERYVNLEMKLLAPFEGAKQVAKEFHLACNDAEQSMAGLHDLMAAANRAAAAFDGLAASLEKQKRRGKRP